MTLTRKTLAAAVVGLAAVNYTGIAAADVTWTFDSANCVATVGPGGNCGSGSGNFSQGRTYQGVGAGAVNVTVSGWANTTAGNTQLELGSITHYGSGLGVRNADAGAGDTGEGSTPEHAVDNDQRYDLVLFDFGVGNSVALNDIQIGFVSGDADINLLAYEGGGAGDPDLTGVVFNATNEGLTANGWTHIADYDLSPIDGAVNADPDGAGPLTPATSRYWIVAAHNSVFGDNCINDNNGCPKLNDHFKIMSVSGALLPPPPPPPNTGVPVPAPLALFGLGLVGIAYGSKRRK